MRLFIYTTLPARTQLLRSFILSCCLFIAIGLAAAPSAHAQHDGSTSIIYQDPAATRLPDWAEPSTDRSFSGERVPVAAPPSTRGFNPPEPAPVPVDDYLPLLIIAGAGLAYWSLHDRASVATA
jgi:hypothetical protein